MLLLWSVGLDSTTLAVVLPLMIALSGALFVGVGSTGAAPGFVMSPSAVARLISTLVAEVVLSERQKSRRILDRRLAGDEGALGGGKNMPYCGS